MAFLVGLLLSLPVSHFAFGVPWGSCIIGPLVMLAAYAVMTIMADQR